MAPEAEAKGQTGEDTARTAGRGGLAVGAAKLYFMAVGFVQQGALAWALGAEGYGTFSRVSAIANVANNVITACGIQGASRTVAEAKAGDEAQTQRGVLKLHAAMAPLLALAFAIGAPLFASSVRADHIALHLAIAGVIVLGYSLYTPLVGTLNGRKRFGSQAALDVTYATMRTVALLTGALALRAVGKGPLGAVIGFASVALLIIPIAAKVAGTGASPAAGPKASSYLSFIGPLALGQLFLNALMQSDITLLGYFATASAEAAGMMGEAAAAGADRSAGIYKACQLFSFLPYQLLLSITFILFPYLAKAHAEGDRESVATYVRTGMRLSMLLAGGMVAVIFGLAPSLLSLTFKPEIADHGATTLRTLTLGQGAFALYGITTAILSSLHRERWTMALNFAATALLVGLSFVIVPGAPVGAPIAERAAIATSIALVAALVAGGAAVRATTGALASPLTALRVLFSFVVAATAGAMLPRLPKVVTPVAACGVGLIYVVCLLLSRELGSADLAMVKRVVGKKG